VNTKRAQSAIGMLGLLLLAAATAQAQPTTASRFWELGWGLYGGEGLDAARFDWHMICFGNVSANQQTVDALNEMLKINPRHKFLIRVWPIGHLGDCPENRGQATLFHYLYQPGVREKLLAETRRQIELVLKGVSRPQNVYGSCFLEELPGHFTSGPFGAQGKPAGEIPWDMKRFRKEIEAELGERLDLSSEKQARWWGEKYCQVLGEIHRAMKEASGGRPVFYYQNTGCQTLDHLERPLFKQKRPLNVAPIRYAQILKPGLCDGIFGYPNKQAVWEDQTQFIVAGHHCLLFSQMSLPPGMRLCKFDEMVELARWNDPGNVGSFLYPTHGRKERAWNELEYQDASSYWTSSDHVRRFAWEHKIGQPIVDRALAPNMQFVYDLSQAGKSQFVHVVVQLSNPREPSWYGGSVDEATLRRVAVTLTVPEGFRIAPASSGPPTYKLGDLGPLATRVADWWVEAEAHPATIPAGRAFTATLRCANGPAVKVTGTRLVEEVPSFQARPISRSGQQWAEPLHGRPPMDAAVEMTTLTDVLCPEVGSATKKATYRDVLRPRERLGIGPGLKARLYASPLWGKADRQFPAGLHGPDGVSSGYLVHGTKAMPVRSGQKYRLSVTGWGRDGGNSLVVARFAGRDRESGKLLHEDVSCLVQRLGPGETTVAQDVEVPQVAGGDVTLQLYFYRYKSRGTVCYKSFDCKRLDIAAEGVDVSGKLEGVLPPLEPPFTEWTYHDLSDPDSYGRPKLELRFLSPAEIQQASPGR